MSFPTIAISLLQKTLKKSFTQKKPVTYVLSNNKIAGGIVHIDFLEFLNEHQIVEIYEDSLLLQEYKKEGGEKEAEKIIGSGDYSQTLSFSDL